MGVYVDNLRCALRGYYFNTYKHTLKEANTFSQKKKSIHSPTSSHIVYHITSVVAKIDSTSSNIINSSKRHHPKKYWHHQNSTLNHPAYIYRNQFIRPASSKKSKNCAQICRISHAPKGVAIDPPRMQHCWHNTFEYVRIVFC